MASKKQKKEFKAVPVAAVAGAVVGAGVAIAGAVALDEKNRTKVINVLTNVKNQAQEYMNTLQSETEVKKDKVKKTIKAGKAKIKKAVASA